MRGLLPLVHVLFLLCIPFSACGEEKTHPYWSIQFAVASEGEGEKISIPKEIESARAALEKLSRQSKFRVFNMVKDATLPVSATGLHQVDFNPDLAFSFRLEEKGEKKSLLVTWLKREQGKKEAPLTQVGGKVRRPFSPGQSLVVLGPPVKEGVAMAVLRLVRGEE